MLQRRGAHVHAHGFNVIDSLLFPIYVFFFLLVRSIRVHLTYTIRYVCTRRGYIPQSYTLPISTLVLSCLALSLSILICVRDQRQGCALCTAVL